MTSATESLAEALRMADSVAACSSEQNVRAFQVAASQLVYLHGPALLAALRLREGCGELAKQWRESATEYVSAGAFIKCADDLARVLEESATGGEAGLA